MSWSSIKTTSLLRASNLRAAYRTATGQVIAVDDVSLNVREGEVLGVAGESGCGKSTLGAILSLNVRPPLSVLGGEVEVEGDVLDLGPNSNPPRAWRGKVVSLLPQGAMNSLNPTLRIRDFAYDVIRAHEAGVAKIDAIDRTRERLEQLDLPTRVLDQYPHQLSGARWRARTHGSVVISARGGRGRNGTAARVVRIRPDPSGAVAHHPCPQQDGALHRSPDS